VVANNRDLTVQFKGDATGIKHASEESSTALKNVGEAASGHGGLLSKLTPVFDPISLVTQGLGMLVDVGKEFVQTAIDSNKSAAALDGVLRNVTHSTNNQVDAQEKWLEGLSTQVGIIDDQLRPAYARLVSATHDTGTAQSDLKLALDVAAGTGKDYNSIVDAMVKAQNGNTGALGRLGIAVKDTHGKMLPLADIIDQLHSKYDGLAAKVADQDPLNKMQVAWHTVEEELGNALLPVIQNLVDWIVNKALPAFMIFVAWLKNEWAKLGPMLAGPWQSLKTAFDDLGKSLNPLVGSGPNDKNGKMWLAVLAGDILAATAQQIAWNMKILSIQIEGMATVLAWIEGVWRGFADFLTGPVLRAVGFLEQGFVSLGSVAAGVATSIWNAFKDAINWIIRAWNATIGKISLHIPGTNIGFNAPQIPQIPLSAGAGAMAAPSGSSGSVINVNLPSGTDGHAIVAALRTYNVRVGGLDLALRSTR